MEGILKENFMKWLKVMNCSVRQRHRICNTDVLIIDEIGMASQKIFEMVEMVCRTVKNCDFLFGGMQVL